MSEETKQKNPHLFCAITGKSRPTTWAYLKDKADRLGTDVDTLINNYVSREAITQLLDGATVEDIRARFKDAPSNEISQDQLAYLIRLNSKAKKAAEKFNMNIVEVNNTQEVVEESNEESNEVVAEKPAKKKRSRKKKSEETPTEEAVMAEENAVTVEVITE
jgi:chromatin remodeling complex protein RSC6